MLACAALFAATTAAAHDFAIADVLVLLHADGTYQVDVTVDVDALALGAPRGADSAELAATLEAMSAAELEASVERARETLLREIRLRFDGEPVHAWVGFPATEADLVAPGAPPTVLGTLARLQGRIPDGAAEMTFRASPEFGPVQLTIVEQSTLSASRTTLTPGEESAPWTIGGEGGPGDGGGMAASSMAGAPRRADVVARYLVLGFEHILPGGLDHILFVLGLFLLSTRLGPLLWQVSAFTVAHTTSLALSMYGVISLPSRLVETMIALSIAYVAIENLATATMTWWRPLLVFGFGLLHGLGFARVLRELGLPRGEFATALVAFNVGVELGQLAVIGLALLAVGWFRKRGWYRATIVVPGSAIIAVVGLWWAVERGLLGG